MQLDEVIQSVPAYLIVDISMRFVKYVKVNVHFCTDVYSAVRILGVANKKFLVISYGFVLKLQKNR